MHKGIILFGKHDLRVMLTKVLGSHLSYSLMDNCPHVHSRSPAMVLLPHGSHDYVNKPSMGDVLSPLLVWCAPIKKIPSHNH